MIFSLCLFEEVWNKMILYEWRKSLFRNVTPALRHRAWITSPVLSLYEFSASRSVRCRTRTVVSFAIWYRCRRWNRDRTNGHDAFPCICSEITSNDWLWRNNDGWLWRNPKPNIYKIYCTCEQIQNMLYMRTYTKYIVHANIYKIYCTCEHIQNILYMRTYTKYVVHANIYKILIEPEQNARQLCCVSDACGGSSGLQMHSHCQAVHKSPHKCQSVVRWLLLRSQEQGIRERGLTFWNRLRRCEFYFYDVKQGVKSTHENRVNHQSFSSAHRTSTLGPHVVACARVVLQNV